MTQTVNRLTFWSLGIIIVLGLVLTMGSLFLIGVEFDEAWIIASHLSAFHTGSLPDVDQVLTTGGLHFWLVGLLGEPGKNAVMLARVISIVSLVLLILLIMRFTRRWIPDFTARMIIIASMIATPGSIFLGSMGYGAALSLLLFVSGAVVWFSNLGRLPVRIAIAGLLFGLALATRWTFVPVLPLLVLSGLVLSPEIRYRWLSGVAVAAVATAVFGFFVFLQIQLGNLNAPVEDPSLLSSNLGAAGISGGLFPTPARMTGFASRYFTLVSVPMVLVSLVFAIQIWPRLLRAQRVFLLALVAASILIALAWMMRSPFLHTRYIWPSILLLNLACGICLALAFVHAKDTDQQWGPFVRLISVALPIGLALGSYTNGLRLIAAGSGYETNNAGYSSQENHFDAFRLTREQSAIVDYLRNAIDPDDTIAGFGLPAEWGTMQLALLSQRAVEDLTVEAGTDKVPSVIISHEFARLSPEGRDWLRGHSLDTTAIYGYQIHRVDPVRYTAPQPDYFVNGNVYRFLLRREQSLSGY